MFRRKGWMLARGLYRGARSASPRRAPSSVQSQFKATRMGRRDESAQVEPTRKHPGLNGTRIAHPRPFPNEDDHVTSHSTETDARIVIDERLREAGWDPTNKAMVRTEVATKPVEARSGIVDRSRARPFETHAPVYELTAAAGAFGPDHVAGTSRDEIGWALIPDSVRLTADHFVARVEGRSMEPVIPDGSWCLFRAARAGSREGKTVLVWQRGCTDPLWAGSSRSRSTQARRARRTTARGATARSSWSPESRSGIPPPPVHVRGGGRPQGDWRVRCRSRSWRITVERRTGLRAC